MTSDQAIRRLIAFSAGRPMPHGSTLRITRRTEPDDILVVAFVRMGGESSPWGLAYGTPHTTPKILTVPEARTRDDVADMLATFAPTLLAHVRHPSYDPATADITDTGPPDVSLRQIWLPNRSHLDMLHSLAYTYHRTRYGSTDRQALLQALARACGWLFREASRPGQMVVMTATNVLTDAYTFPSDDRRQGHLGYLLAWLTTKGRRTQKSRAADAAERLSMSTNLDPTFERTELVDAVAAYNDARATDNTVACTKSEKQIRKALKVELARRWHLTSETLVALERDKRRDNTGVQQLIKASLDEHYRQYLRIEQKFEDPEDGPPFTPSPETDRHPAAAGSRYYVHESSEELRLRLLVHDDAQLRSELIATGEALDGKVVDITTQREGRTEHVFWTIHTRSELPLRLREGSRLCPVGSTRRVYEILTIDQYDPRTTEFTLKVIIGKTLHEPPHLLRATDKSYLQARIVLVKPPMDGIARRRSMAIWNQDVPGSWLTHAKPQDQEPELPESIADNLTEITGQQT